VGGQNCDTSLRMIKTLDQIISPFIGVFAKSRRATINFTMSVRPTSFNDSSPTGRTLVKFGIWVFFENLLRKFKFH